MIKSYRIRLIGILKISSLSGDKDIAIQNEQIKSGGSVGPGTRVALVNIAGLSALIVFTALVYIRTQEPLILLIGGLISVVSVIGTTMGKST